MCSKDFCRSVKSKVGEPEMPVYGRGRSIESDITASTAPLDRVKILFQTGSQPYEKYSGKSPGITCNLGSYS
jgi:hypothetical protein